jgi:3-oxoacyl-[acyl-carrier protein] reductase
MNLDLTGKKALVCGSTQGIGKAIATELATMGASVTLLARDADKLEKVKNSLVAKNGQVHAIAKADFAYPDELKTILEEVVKKNGPYHILINNTGGPAGGEIIQAKTSEFINTFNAHLICNHILAQAVVDGMKQQGYGRIVNIISTSVKQPIKGLGVSNTVRAAVANWSKTLSFELAKFGITVNNVLPGATNTIRLSNLLEAKSKKTGKDIVALEKEMLAEIPAARFAEAAEISHLVCFLASSAAAYINGTSIPVDGGRTMAL